ncbi:MAG TPA: PIN domain-containing protein [Candidatus Binatia bacterium]|nr:PIN domain-containing protein [Candidatus Binatia bacterium]
MVVPHSPRVRRARILARLVGALIGMVAGLIYGSFIVRQSGGPLEATESASVAVFLGTGVAGSAALALAAPLLTVDPFLWMEHILDTAPAAELIGALVGLIVGLLISALVAILLSPLPYGIGLVISLALACTLVYAGVRTGTRRRDAFADAFRRRAGDPGPVDDPAAQDGTPIVLDTSVLIDARITDVAATGFIQGRVLIPGFVLEELQRVADSGDPLRRSRGRRGLAAAEELKHQQSVVCEVIDLDFPGTPEVDARLVKVARARGAALMTNDFNLNRLASVQGIRVLNLNELANALKPVVSSGESLAITIVKEGKEPHQGVGYLDDGTMVVVEGGRDHLDRQLQVTVTSVLQTPAGRMIFATAGTDGRRPAEGRLRTMPRPTRAGGG